MCYNNNRYVVLIMDEMKVQEDLVYDKTGTELLGFTNLGTINENLLELEEISRSDKPSAPPPFATHMLTLMVRGIFFQTAVPLCQFSYFRYNSFFVLQVLLKVCYKSVTASASAKNSMPV